MKDKTHGLKSLRKEGRLKSRDLYRASIYDLVVVDGQSGRDETTEAYQQSILELAQFMRDGGKVPPIEIEVNPKTGDIEVVQGHRRRRAYLIVIPERQAEARELGLSEDKIEDLAFVECLPFTGNALDKVARIASGNTHLPMTDLELGANYKRLQTQFDLNVSEIARVTGHPRYRVDMLLTLANAPAEMQQAVKEGDIKPTEAAKLVKQHGDEAGVVLTEKKAEAKAQGKKRVTSGITSGFSLPKPLVEDLRARVSNLVTQLPEPTREILTDYRADPDQYDPNEFVKVPLALLAGLTAAHANVEDKLAERAAKVERATTQPSVDDEDL